MTTRMKVRTVVVNNVVYIRSEDVAEVLRVLGSTEETDVRNRLIDAAYNIEESAKVALSEP